VKRFRISLHVDVDMTVDELWPDGNAPANPTVDHVHELIRKDGGLDIIGDWCLAEYGDIEVNEIDVAARDALMSKLRGAK